MLRRVVLLSVASLAGTLLGAAPTLAQSGLELSSGQSVLSQAQPALTPSPAQMEFGPVDVHFGNSSRKSVMLTSDSQSPVSISSGTISGNDASSFQVVNDGCSGRQLFMAPENCTVEVSFEPGVPVAESATLELFTSEGETIEVPLSGEGISGTLSASPSPLSFSSIPYAGSSSHGEGSQNETEEIRVQDSADAGTQVNSVSITGHDASSFSVQWDGCEPGAIGPNSTCTMGIRFEPISLGANHAQLVIASDSSSGPLVIALEGEGLHGPKISLSSTQALLGEVPLGSATWHTFTVTNSGDYPLGIQQAFLVSGTPLMFPVLADTCSGQELDPQATCVVTVGFQPSTPGEKDASIIFITSSSLPVNVVGVDGLGVQPGGLPQAVSPGALPQAQAAQPAPQVSQQAPQTSQQALVSPYLGITGSRRQTETHARIRRRRRKGARSGNQRTMSARHKRPPRRADL